MALADKIKKQGGEDATIRAVEQTNKLIEGYRRNRKQAFEDSEECLLLCRECVEILRGGIKHD